MFALLLALAGSILIVAGMPALASPALPTPGPVPEVALAVPVATGRLVALRLDLPPRTRPQGRQPITDIERRAPAVRPCVSGDLALAANQAAARVVPHWIGQSSNAGLSRGNPQQVLPALANLQRQHGDRQSPCPGPLPDPLHEKTPK